MSEFLTAAEREKAPHPKVRGEAGNCEKPAGDNL